MEWKKNDKARYELGLEVGSSNTNAMGSRGGGRGEKAWSRQKGRANEREDERGYKKYHRERERICMCARREENVTEA